MDVLTKYNLVKDNSIVYKPKTEIGKRDLDKLSSSVEYLAQYAPAVLAEKVKGLNIDSYYYNLMNAFYEKTGLPNARNIEFDGFQSFALLETEQVIESKGYDYFFEIAYYNQAVNQTLDKDKLNMYLKKDKAHFAFNGDEKLEIDLSNLVKEGGKRNTLDELTFYGTSQNWDVKLVFKYVSVRKDELSNISAWVFVHRK